MYICFARTPTMPIDLAIPEHSIQQCNVIKLLGVFIQSNLKWDTHVNSMIRRGNSRLYILRKLKHHGLSPPDLVTIYLSIVQPVLEYAVPVWAGGITRQHSESLERVQKRACRIILGRNYTRYSEARDQLHLPSLSDRRNSLCVSFAKTMLVPSSKLHHLLPPRTTHGHNTRNSGKFVNLRCRTERYRNSPIPFLSRLL